MQKTKTGAKTKSPAKESLKAKNLAKTIKSAKEHQVTPKEDTKYHYPAGCLTLSARKEFRRKSRASLSRYNRVLTKLKRSNKAEDKKIFAKTERELKTLKGQILQ